MQICPDYLMTQICKYVRQTAAKINYLAENCIITVPACWKQSKTELAKRACKDAGFEGEVLTIPEPIAAI